ncbi:enolase C-terminal domain-like protein [Pseudonocardia hispaniensis]|uniref:Enolase C-terminal domain-like protein n=1 Tax=Pseudonocardia hispaniensis TaxID=904933 RepID=A0ABW1J836_9PSEU
MRILQIREQPVRLRGDVENAVVNFAEHTVSIVAVVSDVRRGGEPVAGVAFNSIGRHAQSSIIRDRMAPRILGADPEALLHDGDGAPSAARLDPARVLACVLRDEKPGGHGDRASAAAAIELACWDLNAKLSDEPAYETIARHFGRPIISNRIPVYAAGGYYRPGNSLAELRAEIRSYLDQGYDSVKIKIGGVPLAEDLARIDAARGILDGGQHLAVDANGRFDRQTALDYAKALGPYGLRWYEEPGDPLDYALIRDVIDTYGGAVATGENLFSIADVRNLVRYAGLRPERDLVQMDAGLSYGLTEYGGMLEVLAEHGIDRSSAFPHGGHLINLHIAVGLGLGGCESYPGVFGPFGGYSPGCTISDGRIAPADDPGFGLEAKPDLAGVIADLLA